MAILRCYAKRRHGALQTGRRRGSEGSRSHGHGGEAGRISYASRFVEMIAMDGTPVNGTTAFWDSWTASAITLRSATARAQPRHEKVVQPLQIAGYRLTTDSQLVRVFMLLLVVAAWRFDEKMRSALAKMSCTRPLIATIHSRR